MVTRRLGCIRIGFALLAVAAAAALPTSAAGAPPACALGPESAGVMPRELVGASLSGRAVAGAPPGSCAFVSPAGIVRIKTRADTAGNVVRAEFFDSNGRLVERTTNEYVGVGDPEEGAVEEQAEPPTSARCRLASYVRLQHPWRMSEIKYYINAASLPDGLLVADTIQSIRNAHWEWEINDDVCGVADNSSINFTYVSTTTRGVNMYDTFNIVDHGETTDVCFSASSDTLACEKTRFSSVTGEAVESDIRLDNDVTWTNKPDVYPRRWDVWSIMAHEVGHTIQLDHVGDANQVMCTRCYSPGLTWRRQLSLGDALGNNALY